jgi:hypothetical protein
MVLTYVGIVNFIIAIFGALSATLSITAAWNSILSDSQTSSRRLDVFVAWTLLFGSNVFICFL